MRKFRVLSGSYGEGKRHYKKGEIVTTINPLTEMFPDLFEEVTEGMPAPVMAPALPTEPKRRGRLIPTAPVLAPAEEPPSTPSAGAPPGVDVTNRSFSIAENFGCRVFETSEGFFVYSQKDLQEPLNPKPLLRAQVVAFMRKTAVAQGS